MLDSCVEVPDGNVSWAPFKATTKSVLPNHPDKSLHLTAQTAPSTHIMLWHFTLSMAPSYLSFSYMTWTQRGRVLQWHEALSLMPKLARGSSLMTSRPGLALLGSLLSILNVNWMSAYLKISHFLWNMPLLSRENGICRSWCVHQGQLSRSTKALPYEDMETIWSVPACGIVPWFTYLLLNLHSLLWKTFHIPSYTG